MIKVFIKRITNRIKRQIVYLRLGKENRRYLSVNRGFKNNHLGERCFIFGNGPSLSQIEAKVFHDEYVFSCNQISRFNNFADLNSNYHFWADPAFFGKDISDELRTTMKKTLCSKEMIVFVPIEYRKRIVEILGDENLDQIRFFEASGSVDIGTLSNIEFEGVIPSFATVVQYLIVFAIYCGFKEIFLYGCENTDIISILKTKCDDSISQTYGFRTTDEENNRQRTLFNSIKTTDLLYRFYRRFNDYEALAKYCSSRGVKIYNCTPCSLLDCFEKRNLENILK